MKKTACLALLMAAALALGGCAVSAEPAPAPAPEGATARAQVDWPKERLETDENGVPCWMCTWWPTSRWSAWTWKPTSRACSRAR